MDKIKNVLSSIFGGAKKSTKSNPTAIMSDEELQAAYDKWVDEGKPVPPPHLYKRNTIGEYGKKYNLDTLIETGTFEGNMVNHNKENFSRIYSIELDDELYKFASDRFKGEDHITILQGDSGEKISEVLSKIQKPTLFWLDAHYSGAQTAHGVENTPILNELKRILEHEIKNHVILIDDARKFDESEHYPSIQEVIDFIKEYRDDFEFNIEHDIIRITFK